VGSKESRVIYRYAVQVPVKEIPNDYPSQWTEVDRLSGLLICQATQ